MPQDPYRYFRIEARELLEQLGKGVLDLERGGASAEIVPQLLRFAHTLKGASRVVRQPEIAEHAHALEEALGPHRQGSPVPKERVAELLALLDRMTTQVAALDAPKDEPKAAAQPSNEAIRDVRADAGELDLLLDGVSEAHVQLSSLQRDVASLDQVRDLTAVLVDHVALQGGPKPKLRATAEEIRDVAARVRREVTQRVEQAERELRQVRDAAERLRLVPAKIMFHALERTARDAAVASSRSVVFTAEGGEARLEADVLGAVQGALLQTVRNAVAHGIESPAERTSSGKAREGRITLRVTRRGGRVAFACSDDGRGIDEGAVRRAAIGRGASPSDVRDLDANALFRLLLQGGITTSKTVTEVAGRGIGLDIVRDTAAKLGGEVSVRTERGRGTTVELEVPVSLSSLDALIVDAGGQLASIPLDAVRRTVRIVAQDIAHAPEGETLVLDGAVVPFLRLSRLLPGARGGQDAFSVVIVESEGSAAAIGVERLVGTGHVVLRALPPLTAPSELCAGTSLDASGRPQLALDAAGLVAVAHRTGAPANVSIEAPRPILIIDDSLTTRMLEQSILESAGYEVDLATSGEEGLDKARQREYALFLVDVEMPGMDGFTFIERTRMDPKLGRVPAILVTSRASEADRARGKAAGAVGHIEKSEFDQVELLQRIRTLIGQA